MAEMVEIVQEVERSAEGESSPDVGESSCRCKVDRRVEEYFFNEKLHPALSRVNMKAQHVYNQEENGYFRNFFVNFGKVRARKEAWVRSY